MKRWDGVADGTRTHDNRNHNPGLYQLSYSHRKPAIIAGNQRPFQRLGSGTSTLTLKRSLSDS